MGKRLLLRITLLIIGVACLFVYDKFIAKPRINVKAPAPALASGWTRYMDPANRFSIDVPPGFVILDSSRPDFKATVANLQKEDPDSAQLFIDLAKQQGKQEGFTALNELTPKDGKPSGAFLTMWIQHAESLINDSNDSYKQVGDKIKEANPRSTFGPLQKIHTPATDALYWSGTNISNSGLHERLSELVFVDKYDAFFVELRELTDADGKSDLAEPIAQSFREYKQHTGWEQMGG